MTHATATRETYSSTESMPDDQMIHALNRYIDEHDNPGSKEFALHAMVGLVSADYEVLRSYSDTNRLIAQREAIYNLVCNRLLVSSDRDIADAIDSITSSLQAQDDAMSLQIAATIAAVRPEITKGPSRGTTPSVAFSADKLHYLKPSKQVLRGIVVTAVAASLSAGVAQSAAAEPRDTTGTNRTIDAAASAATIKAAQEEVAKSLENMFGTPEQSNTPETQKPQTETPETQTPAKETPPAKIYYQKKFDDAPGGKLYHRSGKMPYAFENSPEGIKYASEHGYDRIDLDIQLTKDGVPVVTHTAAPLGEDRIWAGFTDTAGIIKDKKIQVKDLTFDEISRLKHKDGYGIYSLEHMIGVAAKEHVRLLLEFKTPESLKSHLTEIADMLNTAQVEAAIGTQVNKADWSDTLAHARQLGFWTRNISTHTWAKPKAVPTEQTDKPASEDNTADPATGEVSPSTTPDAETAPQTTTENPPAQEPSADIPATTEPASLSDELTAVFDDQTTPTADTPTTTPSETTDAEPSTTPTAQEADGTALAAPDASADTTAAPQETTTSETPAPATEEPSSLSNDLTNVFDQSTIPIDPTLQSETAKATADLSKAFSTLDSKKIDKVASQITDKLGDVGLLFTYLDVMDDPINAQPKPQDGSTPPAVDPGNKETPGNKVDKNDILSALDTLGSEGAAWKNRAYVVERFVKAGYTAENGMGFAGRFVIESGSEELKPDVAQYRGGPGRGVGQWGNAGTSAKARAYDRFGYYKEANGKYRYGTLRWFAEDTGQEWTNIKTQVDFVLWELDHTEKGAANKLKQVGHSLEGSATAALMYERPASWLQGGHARQSAIKDTLSHAETIHRALSNKLPRTIVTPKPVAKKLADAPADNNQADNGACPTGTDEVKGITTGWDRSGNKKDLTLCAIPGTRVINTTATPHWKDDRYKGTTALGETRIAVNYKIAKDALRMAEAAKADGVTLEASIAYRSLAEQCSIVMKHYALPKACPDWVTPVSGNWKSSTVFSNHMNGLSFDALGASINWIKKHGSSYGFIDDVWRREHWDKTHFTHKLG